MAKISVELDAFYGYSCGFQSHGSNETVEIEISDDELEALKKFCKKEMLPKKIAVLRMQLIFSLQCLLIQTH